MMRDGALSGEELVEIVNDLRTPLATMALETYLLDDGLSDTAQMEVRTAVARITRNIAFLDRLVEELIDCCALAAGELELQLRPTELCTMVVHVVERMVATRDRPRIQVEAPGLVTAVIDDLRIERVLANLITNALKYTPGDSPIVVRIETRPETAVVSVIDAGPGLTPEDCAVVFEKYRRAGIGASHPGTGLGLYVSRRIIEAHGGRIGVESIPGRGARFFFELKIA